MARQMIYINMQRFGSSCSHNVPSLTYLFFTVRFSYLIPYFALGKIQGAAGGLPAVRNSVSAIGVVVVIDRVRRARAI